jgi:O-antigen/teichoic acid export membrane protein
MRLFKNTFVKDTFVLTSGTTIAQAIPLFFYPILSRLYTPEQFGVLAAVTAVSSVLATISTGQYHIGILVSKDEEEAVNMLSLSLLISLFVNLIAFPLIIILYWFGILSNLLTPWLIFIAVVCSLCISIYNVYNEWCVKYKYFKQVTINKITNSGANSISKFLFALINSAKKFGLIYGELLGRVISSTMCIVHLCRKDGRTIKNRLSFPKIKSLAIENKKYPFFSLPGQFMNTFGGQLPVFIFGAFFSKTIVGYYSMAYMVLSLPVSIIGMAIRDAFRQRATVIYLEHGRCDGLYKKVFTVLFLFAFFTCIIAIFILPPLFKIVLGSQWVEAGRYAIFLAPTVFVGLVNEVFTSLWIIADKLKEGFYWQTFHFVITCVSLVIGVLLFKNIIAALICFTIGKCLAYGVNLFYTWSFAKGKKNNINNL